MLPAHQQPEAQPATARARAPEGAPARAPVLRPATFQRFTCSRTAVSICEMCDHARRPRRRACAFGGGAFVEGNSRSGFTLVELMTVMLIIAILAVMLIPSFTGIFRRGEKVRCMANL